ncbi:hypothetical protein BVRB_3g065800 [Beta vulgaris subsp. vulgaris]|uniref:HMG box domain-containing protein n=1 Tax=Beta vulgaris subsp. vulgaris TaxID=3555 RepID=A0A0J8CMU6_BETVV|nr:hypothetical protein BVRB_3g065800 [Beta vulgaris subsp. vulgaris]
MVDQGRSLHVGVASAIFNQYPPPLAKYEDVVASRQLFMTTLEKLHAAMASKFMIPIIGGRDLDLHKLFVEVTSRGGIEKILREKRWKDVTATFNFPSTATNASFVLRKYYYSLLQHYERIYYFKAQDQSAASAGVLQTPSATPVSIPPGFGKMPPTPAPAQVANVQQPRVNTIEFVSGAHTATSVGFPVIGVIDGKFESGYLVTVTMGKEKLKGVMYQTPPVKINQVLPQTSGVSTGKTDSGPTTSSMHRRRRRRKKSEMRKRDPTHPKPNRSGYNFFFAEQHARLKPLHPGKDREISRMIGELWNKLKDDEKVVYQEKAKKDKERYQMEMEDYKERQKVNQVISDAIPIQQRFPDVDVEMMEVNAKKEGTERNAPETPDNESDSSKSEESEEDEDEDEDEDDEMIEKDDENFSDAETSPLLVGLGGTTVESGNAGTFETSAAAAAAVGEFQVEVVKGDEETTGYEESDGSLEAGRHLHGEKRQDSPPGFENSIINPPVS